MKSDPLSPQGRHTVTIGDVSLTLETPPDLDALLDRAAVLTAFEQLGGADREDGGQALPLGPSGGSGTPCCSESLVDRDDGPRRRRHESRVGRRFEGRRQREERPESRPIARLPAFAPGRRGLAVRGKSGGRTHRASAAGGPALRRACGTVAGWPGGGGLAGHPPEQQATHRQADGERRRDGRDLHSPRSALTSRAISRQLVRPGDSIPTRFTQPGSPRADSSEMTKSRKGPPRPWRRARIPD